jgi:integrase
MPRKTAPLTAVAIRAVRFDDKPLKMFDGGGLFLLVTATGKYWRLKYRFAGRERSLSLGVYPDVGLADAREKRQEERQRLAQGIDPSAHRKAEKATNTAIGADTFEAIAREWIEQVHCHNVVPSHAGRNLRRLEQHAFPALGAEPIRHITPARLLTVLRGIEKTGHIETAHRVRTLCGQIFRYAIVTGRAERDVAADLRGALRTAEVKHHAALTDPVDLARLLRAIEGYAGQPATRAALHLAPILFVRPGELRTAKWNEFDLAAGEWDYHPSKGGTPMVTPLPTRAIEILGELHTLTGPDGYVFPSIRGKGRPLSENTLNAALRTMGYEGMMTAHGFRAVARTVLVERLDFPAEWVEMQLGHAVRDALGRAYNRATYLDQRRGMLQAWADYLDALRDSVVSLNMIRTGTDRP